jgi:very-short-patch-repair endonuclease
LEILKYDPHLKSAARQLRSRMTDAETRLWSQLRGDQLCNVRFYRQKPIGPYIVDFYAPKAGLVIEVDGSQHLEPEGAATDAVRNRFLSNQGIRVLHFDNLQVLRDLKSVMTAIYRAIVDRVEHE